MTEVCRQFRLQQAVQHHTLYLKTDTYGASVKIHTVSWVTLMRVKILRTINLVQQTHLILTNSALCL